MLSNRRKRALIRETDLPLNEWKKARARRLFWDENGGDIMMAVALAFISFCAYWLFTLPIPLNP